MFAPPLVATDVAASDISSLASFSPSTAGFALPAVSPALLASHSSDVPASPSLSSSDPRLSRRGPNLSATRRPLRRSDVPPSPLPPPLPPPPLLPPPALPPPALPPLNLPLLSSASFAAPSPPPAATPSLFAAAAYTPAPASVPAPVPVPAHVPVPIPAADAAAASAALATSSLPPFSLSSRAAPHSQPPPPPPHSPQAAPAPSDHSRTGPPAANEAPLASDRDGDGDRDRDGDRDGNRDDIPLGLLPPARKRQKKSSAPTQPAKRPRKLQRQRPTAAAADGQQPADGEPRQGAEGDGEGGADERKEEVPPAQRTLADFVRDSRSGEVSASVRQRADRQRQDRAAARQKRQAEKEADKKRAEEEKTQAEGGSAAAGAETHERKEQIDRAAAATVAASSEREAADQRREGADRSEEGDVDEAAEGGDAGQDEEKEGGADGGGIMPAVAPHLSIAPQMKLVNGQIVVNEESLIVQSPDALASDTPLLAAAPAARFTSATFSKAAHSLPWTAAETALFYRLLSSFGTDFTLLASALSGRSRGDVKRKFKREERERPAVLEEALRRRVRMDASEFGKWRGDKKAAEQRKADEAMAGGAAEGAGGGGRAGLGAGGQGARKRERVVLNNRAGKKAPQQQHGAAADEQKDADSSHAAQAEDSGLSAVHHDKDGGMSGEELHDGHHESAVSGSADG